MSAIKKLIIFLLVIVAISILLQQKFIQETILDFINKNIPWYIPAFTYIKNQVLAGTLMGLFFYLIFVNIPLLPSLPAEVYILYAFLKGTNIFGIAIVTALVYMVSAAIYYLIGYFFGERILEKMFKRTVVYHPLLDKFSGVLVFLVFLLPIPLPIPLSSMLVTLFGLYKTKFIKIMIAVGIATFLRVLALIALYQFYSPVIKNYLTPLNAWLKIS